MQSIKTIEGRVKAILEKDEEARNDDMALYLKVCNSCVKEVGEMTFSEVMEHHINLGLPSFGSVSRTRRKLQAEHYELMSSERVQKLRASREKLYRKYAKE